MGNNVYKGVTRGRAIREMLLTLVYSVICFGIRRCINYIICYLRLDLSYRPTSRYPLVDVNTQNTAAF